MNELTEFSRRDVAAGSKTAGNPEGKGLNGFLLDWYQSEPKGVIVKPARQVLAEFFTSMLILSAELRYKPVVGVDNYLYWLDGKWSLSLIGPDEWSDERREGFVGTCVLQHDMTWTIAPSELLAEQGPVTDAIGQFYTAFAETLDTDLTLEDILPFYTSRLTYYPRLYASAMSRSMRGTMTLSEQRSTSCRELRLQLPAVDNFLLPKQD